ncbi:hypothetical protein [Jiulongibacter sp. NS-SX5]|uniref:hypothetical protein n=1 Tax=Jiulongibacter sp. NS-SX5 TaxID=3463854 RepID=UPI004058CB87
MKRILLLLTLLVFSSITYAQIEVLPKTTNRPSLLSTWNAERFNLGLSEIGVLSISGNQRIGIGTEFTSADQRQYVNYGKMHIRHNSTGGWSQNSGSAHLVLDEAQLGDYARLRFTSSFLLHGSTTKSYVYAGRYWDMAALIDGSDVSDDRINFYNSESGNVMTIRGDNKVGINDSSPERTLDINGSTRVVGYTETGNESIPYKTKLIAFTTLPISCSGGTVYDFSLGVDESRVISCDVLVQTGSSSFYPANEFYNNREYVYSINGSRIYFEFKAVAGCDFTSRGFRVWVTYTDSTIPMPISNGPGN